MNVSERLAASAVVPVVVLDDAKDAVATAKALLAGGVDVMEITFRTAAAADSIKAVAESCPDMLVGAGTVITLEQCKKAVDCGAKFIVSPGFDEEVVRWCVENGIAVTPGCVTPTEIMAAMKLGLNVVKFFPAGVYGGLSAMKEIGNIITGAYLNSLSMLTNLTIIPTPPSLTLDMAGAILSVPAIEFGTLGDKILLIQSQFYDEVEIDGYFILVPDIESYPKILTSLGIPIA